MQFRMELTGTSPLLMHNPRLADPLDPWAKALKRISDKRKKTDEDYAEMSRLEFFGGFDSMLDADGKTIPSQPTRKIHKCLVEAGKVSKLGTTVTRAVTFLDVEVPLIYPGPKDIEALFAIPEHVDRRSAGVRGNRVMRTRPSFYPWSLVAYGILLENAGLNTDEFGRIAKLAGEAIGIGDFRSLGGFGRFKMDIAMRNKQDQWVPLVVSDNGDSSEVIAA